MTDLARIAALQLDEDNQRWRLTYHPNDDEIVECDSLATLLFWLHPRAESQLRDEDAAVTSASESTERAHISVGADAPSTEGEVGPQPGVGGGASAPQAASESTERAQVTEPDHVPYGEIRCGAAHYYNDEQVTLCHLPTMHTGSHRADTKAGQRYRWEPVTGKNAESDSKALSRVESRAERMMRALRFFRSVIQVGEPWTNACEQAYQDALPTADEVRGITAPDSAGTDWCNVCKKATPTDVRYGCGYCGTERPVDKASVEGEAQR